jgi:hypothetical protein
MTDMASFKRAPLSARWPTALGLVSAAGAIGVIALTDNEPDILGPVVVLMAGIYVLTYALGRPKTAWLALVVLSTLMSVLQIMDMKEVLPVSTAVGMSIAVVVLWLWAAARRLFTDGAPLSLQTAGVIGFGVVTLVCVVISPRWGTALAGIGFLAHAAWDAYHFRANKVVHRTYSEYCGVVDVLVGSALILAAFL